MKVADMSPADRVAILTAAEAEIKKRGLTGNWVAFVLVSEPDNNGGLDYGFAGSVEVALLRTILEKLGALPDSPRGTIN